MRPLTYREIATRLGISHARVQQIEQTALDKMAAHLGIARANRKACVLKFRKPTPTTANEDIT